MMESSFEVSFKTNFKETGAQKNKIPRLSS
jgi:hypothetical protein